MRCVAERLEGDVTVLGLASPGSLEMRTDVSDKIKALVREGRTKFLLSLRDVSYLDSSGLGDLVEAHQTAARHEATLKLAHVQDRVSQLLRTVNLLRVFEIFDSEPEALKSFR